MLSGRRRMLATSTQDHTGPLECDVCAQHGRVVNGVKVPCRRTDHGNMNNLPLEANSGRVTDRGKEG
jgi:hypothetical protein